MGISGGGYPKNHTHETAACFIGILSAQGPIIVIAYHRWHWCLRLKRELILPNEDRFNLHLKARWSTEEVKCFRREHHPVTLDTSVPNLSKRNGTTLLSQVCLEHQANLAFWQRLLFFFFKVIVEIVFESFCLQVTNSLKAKRKKEGENKLLGDLGIWWVEKKYLWRQPP